MDPKNPYRSPQSDLTSPVTGVDTTNPFDPSGRFTRLSWLAWNMVAGLASIPVVFALATAGVIAVPDPESAAAPAMGLGMGIGMIVFYLAIIVVFALFTIRRFHDMNASGWWTALMIVPLVSFIVFLVLAIKRGTEGGNRFGPPRPTPSWEKVLGIIYIVLIVVGFIGGIVAAIAIPAYLDYQQAAGGLQ